MPLMRYSFKPKLIPSLAFMVLMPILISLGFWQLGRAQTKQAWMDAIQASQMGERVSLIKALLDPKQAQYHGIAVQGRFLDEPTLLLMHQTHQSKPGVHVLNVFKTDDEDLLILVNRGFLANAENSPPPKPPTQPGVIHGIIDLPKPDRFILGENILDPAARPLPIQRVDSQELNDVLGMDLAPIVVLAQNDWSDGLAREWRVDAMPPEKHLGYAVQWFALAACLTLIYIVVNLKRPKDVKKA